MENDRRAPSEAALAKLESRLAEARVSATSPKGIVKVVYNGLGDGLSMELKSGTKQRYESHTMAGFVTAALRAADRAVDALHQHTVGDLEAAGGTLAEWRQAKPTASMDVGTCFGRNGLGGETVNDSMIAVLGTLPGELRRAARRLWERASEVTDEVTETLTVSYRILRQVCGDPEALSSAGNLLSSEVAAAIARARAHIDSTYPAATESWQGSGAESFREYLPKLSSALQSVEDSANHTAGAVAVFTSGVADIYTTIVDRTEYTDEEVAATVSAARQAPHEAISPVIDIVEEYSTYVEELATTLMNLTSDSHAAGRELARAAAVPAGLVSDGDELRLPRLSADFTSAGFRPVHSHASMDTAAMAQLTSSLSDNGTHWAHAQRSSTRVAERLTPETFGLAGSYFCDDVHTVLDRDRHLYATVNGHMDSLATDLRRAAAEYATADDDIAAELRRYLDDDS